MKKLFFAVAAMAAMLLGMTGCFTTEISDVNIYCRVSSNGTFSTTKPVSPGLDDSELKSIFEKHMLTLGEPFGDDGIIIRRQTNVYRVTFVFLFICQFCKSCCTRFRANAVSTTISSISSVHASLNTLYNKSWSREIKLGGVKLSAEFTILLHFSSKTSKSS